MLDNVLDFNIYIYLYNFKFFREFYFLEYEIRIVEGFLIFTGFIFGKWY